MLERLRGISFDHNDEEGSRKRFGQSIRLLRRTRGFSLNDFSQHVSVDKSYLSRMERGLVPCSGRILEKIADELGASRFDLAIQAGFLCSTLEKFSEEELSLIKRFVDKGSVTINFLELLIR